MTAEERVRAALHKVYPKETVDFLLADLRAQWLDETLTTLETKD